MDHPVFDFVRPDFNADTAAQCVLRVIVGTDGCSLSVTGENNAIQCLKSKHFATTGRHFRDVETQVRAFFGAETIFSYPFSKVHCVFFNQNATLVPRRLFTHSDLPAYFKLLLRPEEYEYRCDELPDLGCFLVYAVEPAMIRICAQYFPEANTTHLAVPLLKNWRHTAQPGDYDVLLNVRNQAAQIAVFDRHNLLYYNTFQFFKPGDLLYFTLLAYDTFRLDPAEIPLSVSGNFFADSEHFRLLHRYVQTIRFAEVPYYPMLPGNAPAAHFWFDLFSL